MMNQDDLIDAVHELSLAWDTPLVDGPLIVFSAIIGQHEDNFERFKNLSPRLQECSAINYLNLDSFTHFALYLTAVEDTGGRNMPGLSMGNQTPREFYMSMSFAAGSKTLSPEFISVLRWFDYYLGRSSSVVLFILLSKYGEKTIVEMTKHLSEFKIDPRIVDFVTLVIEWESHSLRENFNLWTKDIYRHRTLPDEGVDMIPL